MIENLRPAGMPGLMRDRLYVSVRERKNCNAIMAFAEWCYAHGLLFRHRLGVSLVRGSDRKNPTGLKERGDLQELGLTADKIRGAIKTLVEVGFIDKFVPSGTWRPNLRGEARNPAAVYRLSAEFREVLRRARAAEKQILKKAGVAAKAVAQKLSQSVTANLLLSETPLSSPPNCTVQDRAYNSGDLGSEQPSKPPKLVPVEHLTAFDRRMMAINAAVGRASPGRPIEPVEPVLDQEPDPEPEAAQKAPRSIWDRACDHVIRGGRPPEAEGST